MKLGSKYLLHSNPFPKFGEPDSFVEITISEINDKVPCTWGGKDKDGNISMYTGYKGVDADGRSFECNWTSFPSDSMTPMWQWYMPEHPETESPGQLWYSLTGATTIRPKARPPFVDKFPDSIAWCETHKQLHSPGYCFYCKHMPGTATVETKDNGWGMTL